MAEALEGQRVVVAGGRTLGPIGEPQSERPAFVAGEKSREVLSRRGKREALSRGQLE